MQFYSLHIREVRRESPDCVSLAFVVPDELQTIFQYQAGQYLTLRSTINGEDLRRSYSICSAPAEHELRVAVKQVEGGSFSTWTNTHLQAGDTLQVMPPQGRFAFTPDATRRELYVGFAAGSGITPVIAMLKSVLWSEPNSRFLLFYGNKGYDHIIFREELEYLKNRYPGRLAVHHIFSRESVGVELYQGRTDAEKCRQFCQYLFNPAQVASFFLCGPEEMIFEVKGALEASGVPSERIKFELFTTANTQKKAEAAPRSAQQQAVFEAAITVVQDGIHYDFNLPSEGSTLLDAAMRAGADLPFSCKGGVCSTCKARIIEGSADMEVNYGLEPDEVAAGYILTCQAHPKSARLVVSFDE